MQLLQKQFRYLLAKYQLMSKVENHMLSQILHRANVWLKDGFGPSQRTKLTICYIDNYSFLTKLTIAALHLSLCSLAT